MYAAGGKSATKDFMRDLKPTTPQKSYRGFTGAADSTQNVSMMRVSTSSNLSPPSKKVAILEKDYIYINELRENTSIFNSRAEEAFDAADTRTNEIHLEASPPASLEAGFAAAKISVRTKRSTELILERPAGLFGDALPSMATPLDQLRVALRGVLARKRGTQSRLAEALGLSRQRFANALNGRGRFTATAVAALRRWVDGGRSRSRACSGVIAICRNSTLPPNSSANAPISSTSTANIDSPLGSLSPIRSTVTGYADLSGDGRSAAAFCPLQGGRGAYRLGAAPFSVRRDGLRRRVSKCGDAMMRTALYEAAQVATTGLDKSFANLGVLAQRATLRGPPRPRRRSVHNARIF
jgi:hypothetical protein